MEKSRLFGTVCAVLFTLITVSVNAATIALNDWWLQTDSLGGLRQSTWNEDVYFAVSQSNVWSIGDVYEAPVGFHWATTAEGQAIFTSDNDTGPGNFVYFNQGGWTLYDWEGLTRHSFRFSDSDVTNAYKHAGQYDEYFVQYSNSTDYFAGLVLIKDSAVVPLPPALWLFGSGLLGLIGVARRKRQTYRG